MDTIVATHITKFYGNTRVLKDLSFSVTQSVPCAITGANGAGKTTLLEILCRIKSPDCGFVRIECAGEMLYSVLPQYAGVVLPAYSLYDQLTVYETACLMARLKHKNISCFKLFADALGLIPHLNKRVKNLSAGGAQRLKLACALMTEPPLLFLDEPCAFIDRDGRDRVFSLLHAMRKNTLIVIASNDDEEIRFCEQKVHLDT